MKLVLAEKPSRRSTVENPQLTGRTDTHKRTVFGETAYADWGEFLKSCSNQGGNEITLQRGDFVAVKISNAAVTTLKAEALFRTSIQEFTRLKESGDLDKIATTT